MQYLLILPNDRVLCTSTAPKTFKNSPGMASGVSASRGSNAGAVPAALREGLVRCARVGQAALPGQSVDLWNLRKVILQRSETLSKFLIGNCNI